MHLLHPWRSDHAGETRPEAEPVATPQDPAPSQREWTDHYDFAEAPVPECRKMRNQSAGY